MRWRRERDAAFSSSTGGHLPVLGNVLRPTVAVAWLGTFAALALAALPEWRPRLADPDAVAERLRILLG
jgi:hypothetical protein